MSDPDRKFYYVSIIDGKRRGLLAGPYDSHESALAMVAPVRRMAQAANPAQADFAAFGTAGSDERFKTVFGELPLPTVQQPVEREPLAARQGRLAFDQSVLGR